MYIPKVGMKERQRGKAVEDPTPNQNDLILAINLASQGYLYVSFCIFYSLRSPDQAKMLT